MDMFLRAHSAYKVLFYVNFLQRPAKKCNVIRLIADALAV